MKIAVIGAGKLGLPMSAVYSSKGYEVTCIDSNKELINRLRSGECPYCEPLLKETLNNGLEYSSDYKDVKDSQITFVIVPTPSMANGAFSNKYVESALSELCAIGYDNLVVVVSTVMPGSMRLFKKTYGLRLLYNPEFVALGSVIRNMLYPDNILIGESDTEDGYFLQGFHRTIVGERVPVHRMSYENAELAKLCLNCFITTKIAFANQVAQAAEMIEGGNADIIAEFLGSDSRIGKKQLKGGLGFGGTCFPRDNKAVLSMFNNPLATSVINSNNIHTQQVFSRVRKIVPFTSVVSVLGLTYKPDTNVVEESQSLELARRLSQFYKVKVYDPQGMTLAKSTLNSSVQYCDTTKECLAGSELAIIATPWKEFESLDMQDMKSKKVFDCWRLLKNRSECEYHAVGIADAK